MICAECLEQIDEKTEPHWSFHDSDCGFAKRGWCHCVPLSVHPWCCRSCMNERPCVAETPVVVRRGSGVRLPEPLASEEAS